MSYAEMGGSAVVAPAGFILAVAGVGKPGGALPGNSMTPCCWIVVRGAVGGYDVAACGSDVGRHEAVSPAIIVAVGA